jgi:[acyl-carrier-protein] S-malonyltransferase
MNAFLFPGQGSQEVGMGADLFKSDSSFRALVEHASQCVGENLEPICLRGPEKTLMRTKFLQPLLVAVSLGYCRRLIERGVKPDVMLGHSLGEITALAAAGVVTFEDAIEIAAKRGDLMEQASAQVQGGMMAVTTPARERILDWLAREIPDRCVILANDNAPTQIVLSGDRAGLEQCATFIAREQLGRCRSLAVAGPWHSPMMKEALARFDAALRPFVFRPPCCPLLLNASAMCESDPERIRSLIVEVIARPVLWRSCMGRLHEMPAYALFEIGVGRVLAGLARLNGFGSETRIHSVNNLRGVELAASTTL